MGHQMLANDYVVIIASEDDVAETDPYDAVEALLTDEAADVVYLDVGPDGASIEKDTSPVGNDTRRGTSAGKRHALIKERANVSVQVPLRAFVGAGEEPHYSPILKASCFEPEVDTGDVIFHRKTKNQSAFTIYKYWRSADDDTWRLDVATGVTGDVTLNIETGSEATLSFSGSGNFVEITDAAEYFDMESGEVALLKDGVTSTTTRTTGSFSQDSQEPMPCQDMTVEFESTSYGVQSLEVGVGHEAQDVDTVQGGTTRTRGLVARSNGQRSEGSIAWTDYTDDLIDDLVDKVYGAEVFAFLTVLENGDGRIEVASSNAQFMQWSEAENGNLLQYDVPFALNGSGGLLADDELTITYMPAS